MYYIGVDLGTSACKFLLVNEAGEVCHQVTREYPLSMPHTGWSEQDPALCQRIDSTGLLSDDDRQQILALARTFVAQYQKKGQ